jgi:hypothetical protein
VGGATVDWGDVQAGANHAPPIRAISVYPNAMLALALQSFVGWPGVDHRLWREELRDLKLAVKSRLWMADGARFRPHQYLDATPFPPRFDESAVSVHGGAAVAAQAGFLSNGEIKASLARQDADVAALMPTRSDSPSGLSTLVKPSPPRPAEGA